MDLAAPDRARLMEEIALNANALKGLYGPDKINIGALGNLVRQFHVHVVARRVGDPAWPGPVWGANYHDPWPQGDLARLVRRMRQGLAMA